MTQEEIKLELERAREEYYKLLNTPIFQVRLDKLFSYLFNESMISSVEWMISKVLDIDIKDVIGKVTIHNIKVPLLSPQERTKYLDVFVEYNDEKFIFELNNHFNGISIRNTIYGFNVSVSNYPVNDQEQQEKLKDTYYQETHKVTVINLNWHETKKLREKTPGVTTYYLPYDEENIDDHIYRVINVNLDCFEDLGYNESDNSQKFYKLLTISNFKDLREILKKENMLKEYGKKLVEFSKNESKEYMDAALDNYLREYELRLGGYRDGKDDGRNEGIIIGRDERENEITMNLIAQNIGYDVISKATGLSVSEIERMVKNNEKTKN